MKVGSDKNPYVNRDAILFKGGEGPSKVVYEVEAGETLTVEVEFDFSSPKAIRDWSIVAWSSDKELTVKDQLNRDKAIWPYIERQGGSSQPTNGGQPDSAEGSVPGPPSSSGHSAGSAGDF